MSLEEVLKKAVERITHERETLEIEEDIKGVIIEPILKELGWNLHSSVEFKREYPSVRHEDKKGKNPSVDYALKSSYQAPEVFIEAKKIGMADDKAEEQLFRYAADEKVLLLVLTDGAEWTLYAGDRIGKPGDNPADRRLCQMKLEKEEEVKKYAATLRQYLQRDRIVSKKAAWREVRKQYEKNIERKKTRDTISAIWQELLQAPDPRLLKLLVSEVRRRYELNLLKVDDVREEVISFFAERLDGSVTQTQKQPAPASGTSAGKVEKPPPSAPTPKASRGSQLVGFFLDGDRFDTRKSIRNSGWNTESVCGQGSRIHGALRASSRGEAENGGGHSKTPIGSSQPR